MTLMTPSTDQAGIVIADVIQQELESIRTAAASLQSRGLAVISSAGTLVTLLFGISALATQADTFTLPATTKPPLYLAASFLVLAAVAGIATNAPRRSDAMALSRLRPLLDDTLWQVPAFHAEQEVARTRLSMAENARSLNRTTATVLLIAIGLEIAGVACVVWASVSLIRGA
jgi:hypothetical protein